MAHFKDETSGMFFFNSNDDAQLIARKMEITDNVIPSSNSSLANGLYLLGHLLDKAEYTETSTQMLNNVKPSFTEYGSWYSNWANLMMNHVQTFYEIAIVGENWNHKRQEFENHYIPNKMLLGSSGESDLPLLEMKYIEGDTRIYVCQNKSCKMPVSEVAEALKQID